ncbi:MAG: hypothetical protein AVDCRST_MAG33-584 [uncultured Thermomicrobiales bacterium]|uniref:Uncharacterized protein n=1 Tax=uncultured Thermomicrobiales bacterium TaxID=1645740 RepID=A0A6J4UD03_9BACT|nr:MAG: hypothetical protein AVDCRST_MAG33-584 [uncultured Thermomicrobiales bacterium]
MTDDASDRPVADGTGVPLTPEELTGRVPDDDTGDDDEMTGHAAVLSVLRAAFAGLTASDDVEILPAEGDDGTDIAVAGDVWTLYLSGWPGPATAFVAVEDEPDEDADPDAVAAAWRSAVPESALAAMTIAELDLEGGLTAALLASGDPLSTSLAAAIRDTTEIKPRP